MLSVHINTKTYHNIAYQSTPQLSILNTSSHYAQPLSSTQLPLPRVLVNYITTQNLYNETP